MNRTVLAAGLVVALSLAGCAETGGSGPGQGQLIGTGAGAAVGGVAGFLIGGRSATGAVIGTLVGAVIGNRVGAALDEREQQRMAEASRQAAGARTGERITWASRDEQGRTTASGWVMPVTDAAPAATGGTPCRKMRQSAEKNGRSTEEEVTLCRGESGWVMPG